MASLATDNTEFQDQVRRWVSRSYSVSPHYITLIQTFCPLSQIRQSGVLKWNINWVFGLWWCVSAEWEKIVSNCEVRDWNCTTQRITEITRLTEIQSLWDVTSCRWARIPDVSKDRGTLTSRVINQKSTGTLYLEDGSINLLRNVCNCSPACTPLSPQILCKLSNVFPYNAVHFYQAPQDNNPFRACCLTLTNYISVDSKIQIF